MKFKYFDKVKVISGFYEGMEGQVIDYSLGDPYSPFITYIVKIEEVIDCTLHELRPDIMEDSLEKVYDN